MPSETDVAPKGISGQDEIELEISGQGYSKNTFGANNLHLMNDWNHSKTMCFPSATMCKSAKVGQLYVFCFGSSPGFSEAAHATQVTTQPTQLVREDP